MLTMIFYKVSLIVCCISLNIITLSAQEVIYFKQVKVVRNNCIVHEATGGQFISFYKDICYESNMLGESVGHGMLEKTRISKDEFIRYRGKSYWGEVTFKFNKDLSSNIIFRGIPNQTKTILEKGNGKNG